VQFTPQLDRLPALLHVACDVFPGVFFFITLMSHLPVRGSKIFSPVSCRLLLSWKFACLLGFTSPTRAPAFCLHRLSTPSHWRWMRGKKMSPIDLANWLIDGMEKERNQVWRIVLPTLFYSLCLRSSDMLGPACLTTRCPRKGPDRCVCKLGVTTRCFMCLLAS